MNPRSIPKTCATCRHFRPRPPEMPWPRAGVSRNAEGTCARPKLDQRREWRVGTDRCEQWGKVRR